MELIIYSPKEDGFIKSIDWNFEELKKEVAERAANYLNLVYSDDQIKEAKKDRADLNKFKSALDKKRKEIKSQVMDPYKEFETQIKEVQGIVDEAVNNIDSQIKGYEEGLRQEKEKRCKEIYAECVGDLDRIVSWETVFNPKWLNRTTGEKAIREEIQAFVDKVDTELKTIGADTSEFVFEMKEEYLKTFDLARAMAVKQELEEAKAKKAVFEAEQKRIEAERQEALKREAEAVVNAGTKTVMVIELDEDGSPVIVEKETRNLKRVMVTLRVTANENQYPALNTAIKTLREKAEKVELLERKEI